MGWWRAGAHPGDAVGVVVLDGHVDTRRDGPGAFFHLAATHVGDDIVIATDRGQYRYDVRDVRRYPKPALPPELFAPTGRARLVVVTCGGPFDRTTRQYADNTVVSATPE